MSKKNEARGKHAAHANNQSDNSAGKPKDGDSDRVAARKDAPASTRAGNVGKTVAIPKANSKEGKGLRETVKMDSAANGSTSNVAPMTPAWEPGEESMVFQSKKPRNKKTIGIAIGIIAAALVAVYVTGGVVFSTHFYPGTLLNGEDVSLQSTNQVASRLNDLASNYSIDVSGDGLDFTVSSADMGVQIDGESIASEAVAENNAWAWPIEMAKQHDLSEKLVSAYNSSGLEDVVSAKISEWNESAEPPVNATLEYDAGTNAYSIVKEQAGTMVDSDATIQAIDAAIMDMQTSVKLGDDQMMKPSITSESEELLAAQETANKYVQADLNMILNNEDVGEINSDQISQWVTIGDDTSVSFDESAMDSWLTDYGNGFDTVGSKRTYTRPDGKKVSVEGGTYGWEIDTASLVEQVRGEIMNGTQGDFTIPIITAGDYYRGEGEPDWGDYVDVDLSEQHVRYYSDGGSLKWESDCITGTPDGKHDTPTGVWTLFNKESPSTLKGDILESTGAPEYETEVAFWMPFTYSGCGLHDATWQPGFGGTMYKDGYGSHGCVNLPYDAAQSLYDIVAVGVPVIVHW